MVIVWDGSTTVPPDAARALIVARDGCFQLKRITLGSFCIIEAVTRHGPGWDDESLQEFGGERLSLGFAEKIPQALLQQAVAFFGAVYDRFASEAIVLLFYAPGAPEGQKWQIMAPEQEVTGAACHYGDPGPAPQGWFLAGTIHSHGNMGAFHSGTDGRDEERRDGMHITVGGVNSLPQYSVSAVIEGTRFKLELTDIVDGIDPVEFPSGWLQLVRKPTPPPAPIFPPFSEAAHRGTEALETYRASQRAVRPSKAKKKKGR